MKHYSLYIIHSDQEKIAKAIKKELLIQLKFLHLDTSLLEIFENAQINKIETQSISIGLYIGSKKSKKSLRNHRQIKGLIESNIPVIPLSKTAEKFEDVTPKILRPINALHWKNHTSSSIISSTILRLLGLTEKHRRVFISYRRNDSLYIGEQLWEFLSKKGFEVFLDRFDIEPGVDFQTRLTEHLCDKSFLLVLESPEAHNSRWINYEIDFARKNNMGLCVLTWPTTIHKIQGIAEGYRKHLKPLNFKDKIFTHAFLEDFGVEIEKIHAIAMLRRRHHLMESLQKELDRYNIPYVLLSNWSLIADTKRNFPGDHLISITPRPPDIPDLFLLDKHCSGHKPLHKGILIHTERRFNTDREELLKWVIAQKKLALFGEDKLVKMVAQLDTGKY